MTHDNFISIIKSPIKLESPRFAEQLEQFCQRCSYVSGHEGGEKSFNALRRRLEQLGTGKKEQNRLFYMALPPSIFPSMQKGLRKHCYSDRGVSRIIVSKILISGLTVSHTRQGAVDPVSRSRNLLATTSKAHESYRELWIPIGERMKFSE